MKKIIKKGFTLVELLVVIAILAILATVSVVGYTAFITKANNSVAMQELTQVRDMMIVSDYENDLYELSKTGLKFNEADFGDLFAETAPEDAKNFLSSDLDGKFYIKVAEEVITEVVYQAKNGGTAKWTTTNNEITAETVELGDGSGYTASPAPSN